MDLIKQIGVALRQLETRLFRSLSALKKNMLFSFLLAVSAMKPKDLKAAPSDIFSDEDSEFLSESLEVLITESEYSGLVICNILL